MSQCFILLGMQCAQNWGQYTTCVFFKLLINLLIYKIENNIVLGHIALQFIDFPKF